MIGPTPRDLKLISRVGVFAGVAPEAIERLTAPGRVMMIARGEALFRQSDPATGIFIVLDGVLKLYRITCSGEEAIIQVLTRGDSVAAASAFAGHRYIVSAEAVSEARVIRVPVEHVVRCVREFPDIALAIIAATSQNLAQLVQHIEELKAQNGFQRVAEFLASRCPVASGPCEVKLPYDKMLIAGTLGIKPESLSRIFAKLKPAGVEVRGSRVMIEDVAILHELAAERQPAPLPAREPARPDAARAALRGRPGSQSGDSAFELLYRRMAAIDLDYKELARSEPRIFRDLQQACGGCGKQRQCMVDLVHDEAGETWKSYCPNAATLSALSALV